MRISVSSFQDVVRGRLIKVDVEGQCVTVLFTWHAIDTMEDYNVSMENVLNFLINAEEIIRGHGNRFIAHQRLDSYLARVVYEYEHETVVVVTFYISHTNRYFKGGLYEDKILS